MFSGTTGVSFMAEMQQERGIELDVPVPVKLSAKDTYPAVFQFTPTKDISSTQLDITVTSESDDVPAYLKVSRDCKDVKENIDVVDYKGESLRLSFAKKGRITLSKFSTPPLTASTSSWFIGIAIKNASGDTPINARKKVTLTLKRSFAYSYTLPMWIVQCVICILIGLAVSIWAWYNFREYPCVNLCEIFSAMPCFPFIYLLIQGPKTFSYITFIVGSVLMVGSFQFVFADWYLMIQEGDRDHCYYNDFCYRVRYADIPYNLILSNLAFVLHGFILAVNVLCMESEVFARCLKIAKKRTSENAKTEQNKNEKKKKNKSYGTKETGPNEIENENEIKKTEETEQIKDKKLPDHVLWCPDISLHLGDRLVPPDDIKPTDGLQTLSAEANKKKFSFSIPYAFAWALCFEGMYSALYHLCPSKLTFQFDTAFMFVMASLSVMLMYNGIEATPCNEAEHAKKRVGAANFFLFFLVPLFVWNYFGTMYHTEVGRTEAIIFSVCLCLWILIMAVWVVYKLCPKKCTDCYKSDQSTISNKRPDETSEDVPLMDQNKTKPLEDVPLMDQNKTKTLEDVPLMDQNKTEIIESNKKAYETWPKDTDNIAIKWVIGSFCVLGFLTVIVLICLALVGSLEFANAFLYLCLGESALVALGSLVTYLSEGKTRQKRIGFGVVLFGAVTIVIMGIALHFFTAKVTTDKSKSPEKSRDLNQECALADFFDDHDKWHILSSFGLFVGALMMIHLSYESPDDSFDTPPQPSLGPSDKPV